MELKVVFLELNWDDSISYVIQEDDLVQCARFIHQARASGGSVLVHCAQVHACGKFVVVSDIPLLYMFHSCGIPSNQTQSEIPNHYRHSNLGCFHTQF